MKELGKFNRIEVIDHTNDEGRAYTKWVDKDFVVAYDEQDDNKTLKIFLLKENNNG